MSTINYEGVIETNLANFCEQAYLNYALYVIKDRVLPYIGDGLKPVQRRIIYTMAVEGINAQEKIKKSAYTVGQVLGRFHPHGDSACYEAMVIMAQDFSYRYPLIIGQGNFGDVFKPKEFAALRYTEAYLSHYTNILLSELKSGNVEWIPNYSGDENEPVYLPARVPNILLNGTTGIAVGMTTNIPPHNINEVIDATCALIDQPDLTVKDLLQYVKGPDYPGGAEVTNSPEELLEIYTTGRGSIRQRAVWHQEKNQIIIDQLPHQAAPSIITRLGELLLAKKLPTVENFRDYSSETEAKIVLELRSSRSDGEQVMNTLFALSDLETRHTVNLNIIGYNDKPAVKSLKDILTEWLAFRKDIVRKRYQYRLQKINHELMRIEGFLIAFKNLDRVIQIVRTENKPKEVLMKEFALLDEQATAILDLRIRNLSRLDEQELNRQHRALKSEQKDITKLLNNQDIFNQQVRKELIQAKEEFGQERRTRLVYREPAITSKEVEEKVPVEPVTVVISKAGWIRCGKGHEFDLNKLSYRTGDQYLTHCLGMSNQPVVFLDSNGKIYNLPTSSLPAMRGYGEAITSQLKIDDGASIVAMIMGQPEDLYLVTTTAGYGFFTQIKDLVVKSKIGKSFLNLNEQAQPIGFIAVPENLTTAAPQLINETTELNLARGKYWLCFVSWQGRVLLVDAADIEYREKGRGIKLINIKTSDFQAGEDYLWRVLLLNDKQTLTIHSGSRKTNIDKNKLQAVKSTRGNAGKKIIGSITDKTELSVK